MRSLRRQLVSPDCKSLTRRALITVHSDNLRANSKLSYRLGDLQPPFSSVKASETNTSAFLNSIRFVSEEVRASGESLISSAKPRLNVASSESANLKHDVSAEKGIRTGFCNLCSEEGHMPNFCPLPEKPSGTNTAAISNSVSFMLEGVRASGESLDDSLKPRLSAVSSESESLGPYVSAEKAKWSGFCNHCGEEGHMSNFCPKVLAAKSQVLKKLCPCGAGVCNVFTSKTLKNPGRQFYRCPLQKEGGCGFFQWCDMDSYQNLSNKEPTINQPAITCPCGAGACIIRTARTESNNGREFYSCPLGQAGCGFFAWRDTPIPLLSSTTAHSSHHTKAGLSSASETSNPKVFLRAGCSSAETCYKCGKEGHWARDCPARQSTHCGKQESGGSDSFRGETKGMLCGSPQSTREMGAVRESSNCCFKCGMAGHWAKECPN